ncbi:hypothetical protein ACT4UT_21695, partial [Bacillus sp. B-TM1]
MISVNKVFYAHSERFQMQNMNVHIKVGEVVSLIGQNGSGKSFRMCVKHFINGNHFVFLLYEL